MDGPCRHRGDPHPADGGRRVEPLLLQIADVDRHAADLDRGDAVDERPSQLDRRRQPQRQALGEAADQVQSRTGIGQGRGDQGQDRPAPVHPGDDGRQVTCLGDLVDEEVGSRRGGQQGQDVPRLHPLQPLEGDLLHADGGGRGVLQLLAQPLVRLHGLPGRAREGVRLQAGERRLDLLGAQLRDRGVDGRRGPTATAIEHSSSATSPASCWGSAATVPNPKSISQAWPCRRGRDWPGAGRGGRSRPDAGRRPGARSPGGPRR